jgi:hypothetical protein
MADRSGLEKAKDLFEIVAIAIAGTWAAFLFYYQVMVVPSRIPVHLGIDSELEVVGRTDGFVIVKATVNAKNNGDARVNLLAAPFNMKAYHVSGRDKPVIPKEEANLIRASYGDFMDLPRWIERRGEIVNSGRLFPAEGWWLDAAEEQEVEFLTYVPDIYDFLVLRTELHMAKRGNQNLLFEWKIESDGRVGLDRKIIDGKSAEPYSHARHAQLLKDSNPYRMYTLSTVPLNGATQSSAASGRDPN